MAGKGHALSRDELVRALIAYTGTTTDDGNIGGTTLQDRHLIGSNDFISNKTILIGSGAAAIEDSGAVSFAPGTGIIEVSDAFSVQIKAGTLFRILNISTVEIDVDVINTKIGTNTDPAGTNTLFAWLAKIFAKLAGGAIVESTESKLWNTAEQDLVSIGTAVTKNKLHSLIVDISQLTATATINIRLYLKVNGVARKVYDQPFVVGDD
ncbi:unnamed protein product, partial [marine sediment metagenome]